MAGAGAVAVFPPSAGGPPKNPAAGGGGAAQAIVPMAEAVPVATDGESAALREQLEQQARRIAEQDRIINTMGEGRRPGRFVRTEDMNLRLKFLREKACKLAWSPARILPTVLTGWAAMWIFIWCYLWNLMTNIACWLPLQFLHIFSGCNSPFVEYAQHMIMLRAGQQNCLWWKSGYKLEGPDDDHMCYTV